MTQRSNNEGEVSSCKKGKEGCQNGKPRAFQVDASPLLCSLLQTHMYCICYNGFFIFEARIQENELMAADSMLPIGKKHQNERETASIPHDMKKTLCR